ncbi:hypothetical protein [Caulobacter sp. 1776]|uniref:hypothetical protein n=1 Tax=Caulobacter sp. 1776 TaxID=3156420 RepID=UPI00339B8B5E
MAISRRARLGLIAGLSLALHAAVLIWLAWPQAPNLYANGPDLSLMSVELMRPARPERPSRSSLARRATTRPEAASPPEAAAYAPRPAAPVPEGVATIPAPPAVAPGGLQAALRAGVGCARAASRSREEREACEERFGRLDATTPSYDAPMDPGKRAYYDAVAAAGPSGRTYGDPKPGGAQPDGDYFRVLNCSIKFGGGRKSKDRQGEVRLSRTPCSIPLQGSFFTPEASVRKR